MKAYSVDMLLWRMVDLNKRFRQYVYDSNKATDIIGYTLLTCLELKDDPGRLRYDEETPELLMRCSAPWPASAVIVLAADSVSRSAIC
jgi:hypothetical protein